MFKSFCVIVLTSGLLSREALSFSPLAAAATALAPRTKTEESPSPLALQTKDVVTKVAVTGATGRTGKLVIEELLNREVSSVVAVVRDTKRAQEVFPNPPKNLEFVQCDLTNEAQIRDLLKDVDVAIWCATGFSNSPNSNPLQKVKQVFGAVTKRTIDTIGLPQFGTIMANKKPKDSNLPPLPKVVVCSSAGVTRPIWDEEKKKRLPGAAGIPIVRLNPFGILDIKRESEEQLRQSGADYCIVRPGGLNDEWPAGSRPVFSQGDVAVGRINRKDVAQILVDVLSTPEATGKTFEVIALSGYPKAVSIGAALSQLLTDEEGLPSIDSIAATYAAMQQLLPGEQQNSAALAMGQTYEELDQGKTGRLGKRGKENAEAAAPKPSS